MHIPDGFLTAPLWISTSAAAAVLTRACIRNGSKRLEDRAIPKVALLSAFLFSAQLLNFPVGPGVSGHLLGASLSVALVGPHLASLALTIVLIIQCFLFQDGGVLALGANIINMAYIAVWMPWLVVRFLPERFSRLSLPISCWLSVSTCGAACALELWLSQAGSLFNLAVPLIAIYSFLGLAEAAITSAVYPAIIAIEARTPTQSQRLIEDL